MLLLKRGPRLERIPLDLVKHVRAMVEMMSETDVAKGVTKRLVATDGVVHT